MRSGRWIVIIASIVMLAFFVIFLVGCGSRQTSSGGGQTGPAPTFSLQDLNGKTVSLESLRGKVVILDFWATWCGPCRQTMPLLQQFSEKYAGKGVVVIGVNQREPREKVKEFVTSGNFTYQQLLDTDGTVGNAYGVSGIPTLVIIDKQGNIVTTHVGFSEDLPGILSEKVDAMLKGA